MQNPTTDFTSNKTVLREDFLTEIQIQISWISFLPFDWEIQKRIRKTILVNNSIFWLSMCACARLLFLRTVFQILSQISQWNGKKEIQKQMHQNPFLDLAFDCKSEIRILRSKSRFPNRMHCKYAFSMIWITV